MAAPKLKYGIGNSASTTLSSGVSDSDTSFPLTSDTNFAAKSGEGMALIDEGEVTEELGYATGKSGASLTIPLANRGLEGGSAQGHSASATVKGILTVGMWNDMIDALVNELLDQDAGTLKLQGTATVTDILDEDDMSSDSASALATQQSIKAYVDASGSTDGWTSYSAVTPTRTVSDDPTYEISFASVDLTSTLQPGMRMKFTQNSAVAYFIITKVALDGSDTDVTLYGGTDYNVLDTATYTISSLSYSSAKAPYGFTLDAAKWVHEDVDTGNRTQASASQNTWYNLGTVSIDIPIGSWIVAYTVLTKNTGGTDNMYSTLSTANNTESNTDFTLVHEAAQNLDTLTCVGEPLTVSSKTTYYLNHKTSGTASGTLTLRGDVIPTRIKCYPAYL